MMTSCRVPAWPMIWARNLLGELASLVQNKNSGSMLCQPYADVEFIFMFVYIGLYLRDVLGVDHCNICSNHFVRFVWAMLSDGVTPAYYLLSPGDCDCTWFGIFCVLHGMVN